MRPAALHSKQFFDSLVAAHAGIKRSFFTVSCAICLAGTLSGSQSVTVTSGVAYATLPSSASWSSLGAQSSRWEIRIQTSGALPYYVLGLPSQQLIESGTNLYLTTTHNWPAGDQTSAIGPLSCCQSGGDYLIRVQRDMIHLQYTFEICRMQAAVCASTTGPVSQFSQDSWAGWQFYITTGYSVSFLRWFSTTVPVGTPIAVSGPAGDLADWEFAQSLKDSVSGLTFSGAAVTYSTPTAPVISQTTTATANQSVTVSSGYGFATLPSSASWANIGTESSRWELRMHSVGTLPYYVLGLGLEQFIANGTNLYLTTSANPPAGDSTAGSIGPLSCCQNGGDYLLRVQRDTVNKQYTFEVCNTQTGGCSSTTSPITSFGQASWAGRQLYITNGYSLAFLRWFSTTVPVGTPIALAGTTGNVADWEFEQSLTDSVSGLAFSGATASYSPTPLYPPVCNAGSQQSFRVSAGFTGQLDGSGSYSLDGGPAPTYAWALISPGSVTFSNPTAAKPTVSGLLPGSYNFQLTVTDSTGHSTSCAVHDGAVIANASGVVTTGNAAVDQLLGPLIQWEPASQPLQNNPWPWLDDRNKYVADVQATNIDSYYIDYWDPWNSSKGTVSVAAGNTLLTGVGTHFTTDVCGKGGNPTVPQDNMAIIVHWNSGQNRRVVEAASCTSDTQIVILSSYTWNPPPGYPQSESGLQYSLDNNYSLIWQFGGNAQFPGNYYDNVAAFYALYYRSGIDTYLTYARKLADRFWQSPMMDQGLSVIMDYGSQWGYPGRALNALGLVLRALDTADGHPDMWAGLHLIWTQDLYYAAGPHPFSASRVPYGVSDQREEGYRAMRLGLCALYDTSAAYRSQCQAGIQTSFNILWQPVHDFYGTAYFPQWQLNPLVSYGNGNSTYVTATKGSSTIQLQSLNGATWDPTLMPGAIWMWPCANPGVVDGCGAPAGNAGGDPNWYYIAYSASTIATLTDVNGHPVPYTGTSGLKGITFDGPWNGPNATSVGLGWGSQPYMLGIIAAGLDMEAQAMYAGNYNTATGNALEQYASQAIQWLQNYAVYMPAKGMWYFAGHVNCPVGNANPILCGQPDATDPAASRILNAEAIRGAMFTWYHTGKSQSLHDFIDMMVNAQWAKPGTCPVGSTVCVSDGFYVNSYDNGQGFVTGPPPQGSNPKWFGQSFGVNGTASWPAMRLNQ